MVNRPIRLQDAQWAAVRAGYPYPVDQIIVGDVVSISFRTFKDVTNDQRPVLVWFVSVSGDGSMGCAILNDGPYRRVFRELAVGEELTVEGDGQYHLLSPTGNVPGSTTTQKTGLDAESGGLKSLQTREDVGSGVCR